MRIWPHNPASPLLAVGRSVRVGPSPGETRSLQVEAVRQDARGAVVKFAEVSDRAGAEALTGLIWFEPREAFPPAASDEVYLVDLIGLSVRTDAGRPVGTVADVLTIGAAHILVIRDGRREHMVPHVDAFVKRVDVEGGELVISPIDGLID